jgi:hypothetical protein
VVLAVACAFLPVQALAVSESALSVVTYSKEATTPEELACRLDEAISTREEVVALPDENGATERFLVKEYHFADEITQVRQNLRTGAVESERSNVTLVVLYPELPMQRVSITYENNAWDSNGSVSFYLKTVFNTAIYTTAAGTNEYITVTSAKAQVLYKASDVTFHSSTLIAGSAGKSLSSGLYGAPTQTWSLPSAANNTYSCSLPYVQRVLFYEVGARWEYSLRHGSGTPWSGAINNNEGVSGLW